MITHRLLGCVPRLHILIGQSKLLDPPDDVCLSTRLHLVIVWQLATLPFCHGWMSLLGCCSSTSLATLKMSCSILGILGIVLGNWLPFWCHLLGWFCSVLASLGSLWWVETASVHDYGLLSLSIGFHLQRPAWCIHWTCACLTWRQSPKSLCMLWKLRSQMIGVGFSHFQWFQCKNVQYTIVRLQEMPQEYHTPL